MAKNDIMAAFSKEESRADKKSKKLVQDSTSFFTGASVLPTLPTVPSTDIPLDQIVPREVNEFEDVKFPLLADSIYTYGLIQPIIVTKRKDNDKYVICSGHRRYNAVKSLHEEYPDDRRFDTIECIVYEVTDDPALLARNDKYISEEIEDAIYRETNLQSRQLKYGEVAKQIRYLMKRIQNPQFLEKAKALLEEEYKTRKYGEEINKIKLITSVLAAQNYQGWSREKIRQYLVIMETGDEELLDRIENGESVYGIYKQIVKPRKREKSAHALLSNAGLIADDLGAMRLEGKEFSEKEKRAIRKLIRNLEDLLDD